MRTLAGAFTTLFPKNALSMIQASTSFTQHEQKLNIIRFRREPNTDWLFVIINIAVFAQILVFRFLSLAAFFRRGVGKAKLVLTCRCVYVFVSFLRYRTGTWTWLLAESKVNEAMRWNNDFRLVTRSLQSVTGDAVHAKAGNHLRALARSTETLQRKWSVQLWKHLISSPFRAVLIRDKRKRF